MTGVSRLTTTVSTTGQVILPKSIRQARQWDAGTRLVVEDCPEGVVLKTAPHFPETRPEQVFGCLSYEGEAKSIAEMEVGVMGEDTEKASALPSYLPQLKARQPAGGVQGLRVLRCSEVAGLRRRM